MSLSVDRSCGADKPVSFAIIEAVANRENVDPTEIEPPQYEPLYTVCDPEALDALFAPCEDGTPRTEGTVTLVYCGYEITITSEQTVSIEDAT